MKYNVGDKVRIKSLDWYNENKDINGNVICGMMPFCGYMSCRCGTIVTISGILEWGYTIEEDYGENGWTDEMFEGLVEEEIIDIDDFQDDNEIIDVIDEYVHRLKNNECQINLPEGYQFTDENGNIINATKIVLEKKKKEYPKTFRECQKYLGEDVPPMEEPVSKTHRRRQVHLLEVLLICRDAYWKIYGEEMGLGKPWEPNWGKSACYTICCDTNRIVFRINKFRNAVLAFPTADMRDAFYENFKELIESVKELL